MTFTQAILQIRKTRPVYMDNCFFHSNSIIPIYVYMQQQSDRYNQIRQRFPAGYTQQDVPTCASKIVAHLCLFKTF